MDVMIIRYSSARLLRNLSAFAALASFPIMLTLLKRSEPLVEGFFFGVAIAFLVGVGWTVMRFRLSIDDDGLVFRGRLRTRKVPYDEIDGVEVRIGRDKPQRFMGPPPFRELVLKLHKKDLVISSLPMGEEAFESLLQALARRLPQDRIHGWQRVHSNH